MILLTFLLALVNGDQYFGIKYPKELATEENLQDIKFNIANFGFVPYGQRLTGTLVLAKPYDFCKPDYSTQNTTSNNEYNDVKILLVVRGECTFYQKTINAQLQGYQMLVIVDDKVEDITKINLISFNSSQEIDIPAILISKNQGEQIRNFMEQNQEKKIHIFIRFPEMMKSEIVRYQYWFSAMDAQSYQFLEQFYPFHMEMQNQLNFTPHYAMIRCGVCNKTNYKQRDQQCLSGGRYCAADPDGDGPLTGQDAVKEIIRQICIYQYDQNQWWNYIIRYADFCLGTTLRDTCHKDIMDWIKIDSQKIDKCFNDSFNGKDFEIDDNKLLAKEYESNLLSEILSWPTLLINELKYKGSLTVPTYTYNYETGAQELLDTAHFGPLQTVCRSFEDQSIPDICKKRMVGYITKDGEWVDHSINSDTWIVWIVVITTMILLMICTTFFYKRWQQKEALKEVSNQVNIHLANYYALAEKEKSMRN